MSIDKQSEEITKAPKSIAIVGLGGISGTHLHHLGNLDSFRIIGGVDTSLEKRQQFEIKHHAPSYASLNLLLASQKPDGVLVATPPSVREEIITEALNEHLFVLSEKPLASTAISACQLALHPNADRLHVGYCHRFTGATQIAKKLVNEGAIGDIIWMNICFSGWMPSIREHWMTDPPISGGGALHDNGCHALDLFCFLNGTVQRASGLKRQSWPGRGEDSFAFTVQSQSGVMGIMQGSYLSGSPRNEWEIMGTKGALRYDYSNSPEIVRHITPEGEEHLTVAPPSVRFLCQLEEWRRAIAGHKTMLATAEEGAQINRILEQIGREHKQ